MADLAIADARTTGHKREALFYGAIMFAYKAAKSATALVFPSSIILGVHRTMSESADPTTFEVTLSAVVAGVLAFVGVMLLRRFDESEVLGEPSNTNISEDTTVEVSATN